MKIAIVCDWLTGMRGGERCLEVACELYPGADIFTLVYLPGTVSGTIETHKIYTSYIQRLPGKVEKFRRYLPIFPHAIQKFDLNGYGCILSFSHCVAKSVVVPKDIHHICYCHSPMRYAWHMRRAYLNTLPRPQRPLVDCVLNHIKVWDRKTSSRVTHFIANSRNVQNRIKEAYNRESIIIYPPVQCDRFSISGNDDGYYLVVSAMVPYKRIDIAVRAFSTLGRKLVVVGNGPQLPDLKRMASANIFFVDNADDDEVAKYMKNCTALVFPGEEDFGIVPLEVQACGKPVIAFGKGGALETVIGLDGTHDAKANPTGLFFYEQSPESLQEAILLFEKVKRRFDPQKCRTNALAFDRPIYKKTMQDYIRFVITGNA